MVSSKETKVYHPLTPRLPLFIDLSPPSVGPPPNTPSLLDKPGRGFFSSGLDLPIVGGPSGSALDSDPFFFFPLPLRPSSSATSSFSFFFFSSVSCSGNEASGNTRRQHTMGSSEVNRHHYPTTYLALLAATSALFLVLFVQVPVKLVWRCILSSLVSSRFHHDSISKAIA